TGQCVAPDMYGTAQTVSHLRHIIGTSKNGWRQLKTADKQRRHRRTFVLTAVRIMGNRCNRNKYSLQRLCSTFNSMDEKNDEKILPPQIVSNDAQDRRNRSCCNLYGGLHKHSGAYRTDGHFQGCGKQW